MSRLSLFLRASLPHSRPSPVESGSLMPRQAKGLGGTPYFMNSAWYLKRTVEGKAKRIYLAPGTLQERTQYAKGQRGFNVRPEVLDALAAIVAEEKGLVAKATVEIVPNTGKTIAELVPRFLPGCLRKLGKIRTCTRPSTIP